MGTHGGSTGLGGGGRFRPGHTLASAGAGPRPRPHPADVPTHGRTPAPGGHVLSVTPRNSRRAAGLNGSDDHVPGPSQGDVCLVLRQKHPGAVAGSQRPRSHKRREAAASDGQRRGLSWEAVRGVGSRVPRTRSRGSPAKRQPLTPPTLGRGHVTPLLVTTWSRAQKTTGASHQAPRAVNEAHVPAPPPVNRARWGRCPFPRTRDYYSFPRLLSPGFGTEDDEIWGSYRNIIKN